MALVLGACLLFDILILVLFVIFNYILVSVFFVSLYAIVCSIAP